MYDAKDGKLNVLDVVAAKPRQRRRAKWHPPMRQGAEAPKREAAKKKEARSTRKNGTFGAVFRCGVTRIRGSRCFRATIGAVANQARRGFRNPPAADHQRAGARQRVCAGGAGLHHGHGVLGLINSRTARLVMIGCVERADRRGVLQRLLPGLPGPLLLLLATLAAIPVCMALGYVIERVPTDRWLRAAALRR